MMIFHRVKSIKPLPDKILLAEFYVTGLFELVRVDAGGYGIIWNDELDLDCNELYYNGY